LVFLDIFAKNSQILIFTKIRLVGAFVVPCRRTDRRADRKRDRHGYEEKLIISFRNFCKNKWNR